MTTLNIDESYVREQEEILASFLQSRFPNLDLSPGSVLRTGPLRIAVYPFAILRAMIEEQILPRLSLVSLENSETSEEIDTIVDQLLGNWFLTRKDGEYARGTAIVHVSRRTDITIPSTTQFLKNGQIFILNNNSEDWSVASSQLTGIQDEDGNTYEWTTRIPLIANSPGGEGEIEAGSFESWSQFNPFVTNVEAETRFFNGVNTESSVEMIDRSKTAVAERSLITKRSIDATLREEFTQVSSTVIIGATDPEMMRDLKTLNSGEQLHVLNHVNIYIPFPIVPSQIIELEIGAAYTDPGQPDSTPVTENHTVVLPAIPFMRIVEVKDITDTQTFSRTNTTPDTEGEYQVIDERPTDSFSSRQYRKILIYDNGSHPRDGNTLQITYDTVQGFTEVDAYSLADNNRVLASDTLVFSQYPVWLEFSLNFNHLDSAVEDLDIEFTKEHISSYIKSFPPNETISVSAISTVLQSSFSTIISSITPFTITYKLECPDGRLIEFETEDKVVMDTSHLINSGDITDFYSLQLSDRTVRYITAPDLISIEEN